MVDSDRYISGYNSIPVCGYEWKIKGISWKIMEFTLVYGDQWIISSTLNVIEI